MTESNAELVTFTPEQAARILELENVNNRKIRKTHVARLAAAMKAGRFVVNGETVIYNDTYLLDGQHRFAACVLADVPFTTWVIRNVPSDAMPSIDKGVARTLSDTLSWAGQKNAPTAASTARRLVALADGHTLRNSHAYIQIDDFTVLNFMDKHEDVVQFGVLVSHRLVRAVGLSRTAWSLPIAWIAFAGNDQSLVQQFFYDVAAGAGLQNNDPRWALREWANRAARDRRRLRDDESLIAVTKAWNAWVCGDKVKLIKVLPTESIPKVVVA